MSPPLFAVSPTRPRSGVPECAADLVRWYQDISPNFPIALSMDQLNRRKCIPSVAATLQCVNHAGRRMSHPDLDSYLTLFYPEEWEDENDNDPEAVKFLLEMWRVQVKEWMENSLGAVYSERTWTKKIQEHISALMAMPFQMSSQFVMIKVEHLLIPNAKPKMSWRKEILDRLEGKMLYVTILYDDEDFLSDLPPGRSSGYARIERLADEKKKDLIRDPRKERTSSPEADAGSEEKRPLEADLQQMGDLARFRALMEDEGDEMPDFIELEDLKHFGYWCQHQDEFKVRLPATANQFKLMVWMQHNVDGKMTEELLGISDPFDLILPEDLSSMGADEADQRRIYFYSSWTTESGRLQRIQESSKDQTENHSFFPETKRKVRDYFNPPITKSDVRETMGFVDFKVRPASQEENDEDEEALIAVRDVVAGSSELNKAKLRRHLDRQTIFAKFFGLAMEVDSSLEEHLDKLKEFRATHQSGALFLKELRMETGHKEKLEMSLLENNIRRSLWERDAMDKAIKSLEKGIAELKKKKQKNLERQKGMEAVESYRIQERWRGSFCTHETVMDFESALLLQLQTFRQGQQSDFTSILHYVLMADDVKPNKVGRPDSVPPHMCEIVCNTVQDVPRVQLRCSQFSSDVVFKRETNGSNGDGMPALVNARLCFQAVGAEAEKYYKAFAPEPGEWMIVKDAEDANLPEWKPVFLYWDGFARWVVSPFRGEPAPYGLKTDQNQGLFLYVRDSASSPDRIKKGIFMKWHVEAGVAEWKEDPSITVISKFNWKSFGSSKGQQLATHAKTVDQSGQSSTFGKIFNALMFVFVSTSSKKTLPEIKDGLIGLEGRNIIFAWKDLYQESLAPFRSFLLEEFGSYHAAWVFLCRNCTISKSRCVRNLARMLKRCHEETQAALKARAQAAGKGKKKFQRDRSMREGISQGHVQEKRSMMDHDERKKKANLFLSMLGKAMVEKASPVKEESNEEKALERMQEYLHARVAGGSLEAICQELLNQLDHNENGNLEVHEILSLEKMLEDCDFKRQD